MSLNATQIKKIATKALGAVEGLLETCSYIQLTDTDTGYDPTLDADYVVSETKVTATGLMFLIEDFTIAERGLDDSIDAGDLKATIDQNSFGYTPVATFVLLVPQTSDRLDRSDGSTYTVVNIKQDPVGATWTLKLRKTSDEA